jgi:beta-glucanase (GH16 family)
MNGFFTVFLVAFVTFTFCVFSTEGLNWKLVWNEEFDGTAAINRTRWTFQQTCSPQNQELQCYTDRATNAYIKDGNLVLQAKLEPSFSTRKKYTSARLNTQCAPNGEGSWYHGRFEMRARLPNGRHLWPAFWLIPSDNYYGSWPRSGEIDIMEYRGQETSKISSALHYGNPHRSTNTGPVNFPDVNFSEDFHTFELIWNSTHMKFRMDGKSYWTVGTNKNWGSPYTENTKPWDQRFHIIINLAVGGNFFNSYGPALTEAQARAWAKPTMEIDYIRVYRDLDSRKYNPAKSGLPSTCPRQPNASTSLLLEPSTGMMTEVIVAGLVMMVLFGGAVAILKYRQRRRQVAVQEKVEEQTIEIKTEPITQFVPLDDLSKRF